MKYPFHKLRVGQSFEVVATCRRDNIYRSLLGSTNKLKRLAGKIFKVEPTTSGFLVTLEKIVKHDRLVPMVIYKEHYVLSSDLEVPTKEEIATLKRLFGAIK